MVGSATRGGGRAAAAWGCTPATSPTCAAAPPRGSGACQRSRGSAAASSHARPRRKKWAACGATLRRASDDRAGRKR
eukprot:3922470-Prymnesium_polylepis.1